MPRSALAENGEKGYCENNDGFSYGHHEKSKLRIEILRRISYDGGMKYIFTLKS